MRVLVGMSGGVDSSVSALLLKQQGHDVLGATMKLLDDDKTNKMLIDAKRVCEEIGIPHVVFDLTKEFREKVIDNFVSEYQNGKTPNPCVRCNKYLKFGLLYKKGLELGYDYIATGHYVDINDNTLCACNNDKDQSYFLCAINKDVIPKIIFPLKNFKNKEEIREIARLNNLSVFNKKDSQEICFIENDDYISYLKDKIKATNGNIVLKDGQIIGKHQGLYKYTIGQRKGLGIAYNKPLYVVDIDILNNQLVVGSNDDLFSTKLIANNLNILVDKLPKECLAKVRSRGDKVPCYIQKTNDKLEVTVKKKVRAITKGQSVVLYKDNVCLGGGIIEETFR